MKKAIFLISILTVLGFARVSFAEDDQVTEATSSDVDGCTRPDHSCPVNHPQAPLTYSPRSAWIKAGQLDKELFNDGGDKSPAAPTTVNEGHSSND